MTICTVIIPVSAYADNYYISGVDISEHNDNVNLSALKAQGYSFVMNMTSVRIISWEILTVFLKKGKPTWKS